jgi:hypothetical protein
MARLQVGKFARWLQGQMVRKLDVEITRGQDGFMSTWLNETIVLLFTKIKYRVILSVIATRECLIIVLEV